MKRLVCATLALTLLGTAAASAQPYGRGGYGHGYRGHDNTGALIGLGIGLFALGAIVASQHDNDRDRYDDRYQRNYGGYRDRGGYSDYRGGYNDYRGGYSDYRGNYQDYRGNGYDYGYR